MPIYSSEPAILRPKHFFMQFILGLSRSGTLAYYLFLRDLKSRYRQSFFSYLWILIPPVATSLTFIFLESSQLFQVGDTLIPYPLYVLSGALAWQLFVDSLNLPLRVISSNRKMLVKINFPRESLVLAGLSQVFFNFAIRILVFLPVFIYYGITPSGILVFLPLVIMALVLFGLALGLLLTPLGLLYQDIEMSLLLMTSV
jgi:lipopolysaccharide transport system permease protein